MDNPGPKAVIHLNRLKENIRQIKNHIGNIPMCCVVKANAYGHGAVPISQTLEKEGIKLFAVFSFDEALELRQAGIQSDILIFSKIIANRIQEAVDNDFILNFSSLDDLNILENHESEFGQSPRFHIKFDTGMTRLGLDVYDADEVFQAIFDNPNLRCEGIYSHFATADEGELSYANYQLDLFNNVVNKAEELGITFKYIHCSNSGAILNLPNSRFNLVRVGMLMYGALPSNEVPQNVSIKPVMNYQGTIVNLRRVPKGTSVSYGGIYKTEKETNIAVVQTGFADGFPRPWYVDGYVGYKGKEYKIAGRVCMDSFMIDFGNDIPTIGDDVLYFGLMDENHIPVESIANTIDSTTYILLTAIGGRTEYIYINE